MAGDWIKVEKSTLRKPEILRISELLSIDVDHAFGLCVRFWCWCDDHLTESNARSVTKITLDALLNRDGFTDAMVDVGWLSIKNGAIVVTNFDRHLSKTAKARTLTATRAATLRSRKSNAPIVTEALPREEKRREYLQDRNPVNKSAASAARFVPPSVDDVRGYCSERKNSVDPQAFVDFYSSKGWLIGKNRMKDWKAAIRTWERSDDRQGTGVNVGGIRPSGGQSQQSREVAREADQLGTIAGWAARKAAEVRHDELRQVDGPSMCDETNGSTD
jgi:hypothetical protein